jgi:chromosome segregation ATPase
MAKKAPPRRKPPKKRISQKSKTASPKRATSAESEERLREAMEELAAAREELSRLGHAMTAAHRQIEDDRLSSASAREHLRAELNAVRTDLKTALAEAEIARIDRERIAASAQKRIHELEETLATVRSEVAELRAAPLPPPPETGDGDKPIS